MTVIESLLGVSIISILVIIIIFLAVKTGKVSNEYSRDNYYQMTHEITDENIKFYVHDSQLYLDDTFSDVVGTIYKGEDGTSYIDYKGQEYNMTEDDLQVRRVKKTDK